MGGNICCLGDDEPLECANCGASWSVELLLVDIGRARLRREGFICLLFDDDAISINRCPHCDLPFQARELFPSLDGLLAL